MTRRLLWTVAIVLVGLSGSPACADYGGVEGVEAPFEAKVTVEVHPLNADVWLDGAYLGGSRELTNLELTVLRGRRLLTIAAPGYKSRFIVVDATTERASRVTVDLIPDRKR
jgi:hypothetical protein